MPVTEYVKKVYFCLCETQVEEVKDGDTSWLHCVRNDEFENKEDWNQSWKNRLSPRDLTWTQGCFREKRTTDVLGFARKINQSAYW